MKTNSQTILLEQTVDYVNGVYHLDTSYNVTQFRQSEKAIIVTLANGTQELTIKIKGQPKFDLEMATHEIMQELGYEHQLQESQEEISE